MTRLRPSRVPWQTILPDSITRWVLLLGLLGVLPLILLTPPLQVADEPQHFERAYQISRLDLVGHTRGHGAGAVLPASLSDMVRETLGTTDLEADRPFTARPLATSLAGLARPLDPERVRYTEFTGAAPYSPLPYIPQAGAIALGRLLGMGPLALLYAARLANGLAAILLLTIAVRTAPIAREAFAFAGLMPMALYQYASASPDAMTIASALLFTAIATRALVRGWNCPTVAVAAGLGAVFCSHKLVYAPILLVALIPPVLIAGHRVRAVVTNGVIASLTIGTAVGWLFVSRGLPLTRLPGTDVHAQAAFIIGQPVAFLSILWTSLQTDAARFLFEMVGVIGWSAMPLPPITYMLALTGMILAVLIHRPDEPEMPRIAGVWQFLLVAGGVVLVEIALYLTWNPVGSPAIAGVQGRYFLPLLCLLLVALRTLVRLPRDEGRSRLFAAVVLALATAQILTLHAATVSIYSVF